MEGPTKLDSWLTRHRGRVSAAELARRIGVDRSRVSHWKAGKGISNLNAILLEYATTFVAEGDAEFVEPVRREDWLDMTPGQKTAFRHLQRVRRGIDGRARERMTTRLRPGLESARDWASELAAKTEDSAEQEHRQRVAGYAEWLLHMLDEGHLPPLVPSIDPLRPT